MTNKIFLNFSNHPSTKWAKRQLSAAHKYGAIIDLPFPSIDPLATEIELDQFVDKYYSEIKSTQPTIIHLMGELTFTYRMVDKLKEKGYTCIASTTERNVEKLPDGSKRSTFEFVKFRKY